MGQWTHNDMLVHTEMKRLGYTESAGNKDMNYGLQVYVNDRLYTRFGQQNNSNNN